MSKLPRVRHYHVETAQFFARNPYGGIASSNIRVQMGSPGESYVMVPPEVGAAFKNHIFSDTTMVKLTFFHDAQLFTHGTLRYPGSVSQLIVKLLNFRLPIVHSSTKDPEKPTPA